MNHLIQIVVVVSVAFFVAVRDIRAEDPRQQQNVVYAERHGVGLVMDIFTPKEKKNGLAIVDVVSGGWSADRGKIRDHQPAQVFKIMCEHGYTVFAIRPGSLSRFSLIDMVEHLETGVRWVKEHAAEYEIDPTRMGIMGASAGGHLASLLAVRNGSSDVTPGIDSAAVKAAAVFFPPTDLLEYADQADEQGAVRMRDIVLRGETKDLTDQEVRERLTRVSPARLVTKDAPPFLLIHGTADEVVPQRQSEKLKTALEEQGVSAELILKEGGGHPWLTIHEEVAVIADWFDERLAGNDAR